MHKPVFAAVQGGEGHRTYQLPALQFSGTYRAGLGIAGRTFAWGFVIAASGPQAESSSPSSKNGNTQAGKEGIAKAEKDDSYNYKNQNFKNFFHGLACLASWRPLR